MWWTERTSKDYYLIRIGVESFYPRFSKASFLKEVRTSSGLTNYHKKQIVRAINRGLADKIAPAWQEFRNKKIPVQELIQDVNRQLIDKEIKDDRIFFSSLDEFLTKY